MFTGIVTAIGRIEAAEALGEGADYGMRLGVIVPPGYLDDVREGDSIALNGACMTVTGLEPQRFTIEISAESLRLTAGLDGPGEVNLEKALRASDRLGGHIVTGHVDGMGTVLALDPVGESHLLRIAAPQALGRFLAGKGSVAVQGVSLTVNGLEDTPQGCVFDINLIAHTLAHTTLGQLRTGSRVNLEVDVIARYAARWLAGQPGA